MPIRRGYKLVRFRFLRVLRTVRRDCAVECKKVIDFTLEEARHLLDHNEGAIALEILLGNLCEVSYPVSDELLTELRWLANGFLIAPAYADLVNHLQP